MIQPQHPELFEIAKLFHGKVPPYVRRLVKQTGLGINRHAMIQEDESILIASSGGKDSLVLALALALRKRWLPVDYRLTAVQIDWIEHPIPPEGKALLEEYFSLMGIPFSFVSEHMYSPGFKGRFNCYLCSRNRKRVLFNHARDRNISTVALGHHKDDIITTTLMNLFFHGTIATMKQIQTFFDDTMKIIRPMCLVDENKIASLTRRLNLPVVKVNCPYKDSHLRGKLQPIIKDISKLNQAARDNIYYAPGRIIEDYLPLKELQEAVESPRIKSADKEEPSL